MLSQRRPQSDATEPSCAAIVERRVQLRGDDDQPSDEHEREEQRGSYPERAVRVAAVLDETSRHVDVEHVDEEQPAGHQRRAGKQLEPASLAVRQVPRDGEPRASDEDEVDEQRGQPSELVPTTDPADDLHGRELEQQREREHADAARCGPDAASRFVPGERVHLRDRAIERDDRVEDGGEHQHEDDRAVAAGGGRRDLRRDQAVQARFRGDGARALVDAPGVQPEAGDEQQRRGEQKDEEAVGERARKQAAADRRVTLEETEPEVDRSALGPCRLHVAAEHTRPLGPPPDRVNHAAAPSTRADPARAVAPGTLRPAAP